MRLRLHHYLLEEGDLLKVFSLVNNYLDPGGIFIFDMNTLYKYRELLGDGVICENREQASFIWENYFDEDTRINEYDLTLFIEEGETGLYRRYEEFHYQKAWSRKQWRSFWNRRDSGCWPYTGKAAGKSPKRL